MCKDQQEEPGKEDSNNLTSCRGRKEFYSSDSETFGFRQTTH